MSIRRVEEAGEGGGEDAERSALPGRDAVRRQRSGAPGWAAMGARIGEDRRKGED